MAPSVGLSDGCRARPESIRARTLTRSTGWRVTQNWVADQVNRTAPWKKPVEPPSPEWTAEDREFPDFDGAVDHGLVAAATPTPMIGERFWTVGGPGRCG